MDPSLYNLVGGCIEHCTACEQQRYYADTSHNNAIVPVKWCVSQPTCCTTVATPEVFELHLSSGQYICACNKWRQDRTGELISDRSERRLLIGSSLVCDLR
jgi:hypothetical protein